jgi:hypothetical protein
MAGIRPPFEKVATPLLTLLVFPNPQLSMTTPWPKAAGSKTRFSKLSTTAVSTSKKPQFCMRNDVEFSAYRDVTTPVGVLAKRESTMTSDPTP